MPAHGRGGHCPATAAALPLCGQRGFIQQLSLFYLAILKLAYLNPSVQYGAGKAGALLIYIDVAFGGNMVVLVWRF